MTDRTSKSKRPAKTARQLNLEALKLQAIVLYTTGGDGYQAVMDELTQICTKAEWDDVCMLIDQIDVIMVDAGCGTVVQVENVLAKREGRESRAPIAFDDDLTRWDKCVRLAYEFKHRGLRFDRNSVIDLSALWK